MKQLYFLLFFLTLSFSNILTSFAQQAPCAAVEVSKARELADPEYAREREDMIAGREQRIQNYLTNRETQAIRKISVVVHVVYNGSAENVSDALIADMIQTLNEDYSRTNADASDTRSVFQSVAANPQIEFCLDQTIRVATTEDCYSVSTETNKMKYTTQGGSNAVDPDHFLNIWIVDICGGTNSGTAGYAYLPTFGMVGSGDDGLVLDYSLGMGSGARTATHEIGHYFNLCHTWSCDDSYSCSNDDGFSDTPQSYQENFQTFSDCFDPNVNSCTSGNPDLPDQTENYMDYATCPNMFTIQQAAEMNSILSNERSDLLNSPGCSSQSGNAPVADFTGTPTQGPPGTNVQFTDFTTNSPTQWAWTFGDGGTSTTQHPSHTYANVGLYTVTLTATNLSGNDTRTRTSYINIFTGGGSSTCDTIFDYFDGSPTIYTVVGGSGGYIAGNNGYGDKAKAQAFPVTAPITVQKVILIFGAKKYPSNNANSKINVNLYAMDGTGTAVAGTVAAPGTILATIPLTVAQIDTTGLGNIVTFSSAVALSSAYAAGFDVINVASGDSVGLVTTFDGDALSGERSWEKWSTNAWHTLLQAWPLDIDLAIFPVECTQVTVGTDTPDDQDVFIVYPNPARDLINMRYDFAENTDATFALYNSIGQQVYSTALNDVMSGTVSVNVANYSAGIYFIHLTTPTETITEKIIISEK